MVTPINTNLPITTTGVISGNPTISDNTAQAIAQPENPASVVQLSTQAQTLLQSANAAQAETAQTELIQAEITQNNAAQTALETAQTLQQQFEQLAAQAAQTQATLTQNLDAAQLSALDSSEATVANQALQSALADAALNEAITTTAASSTAAAPATPTLISLNTVNTTATTTAPTPAAGTVSPTTTEDDALIAAEAQATQVAESTIAEQTLIATVAVETTPITDPTIAAAIAAYKVNDTILAEGEPLEEQAPPETEMDVEATVEIQDGKVDLHDSARDEPLHGVTWNWQRINPLARKNS